jgi:hypothetical protein
LHLEQASIALSNFWIIKNLKTEIYATTLLILLYFKANILKEKQSLRQMFRINEGSNEKWRKFNNEEI